MTILFGLVIIAVLGYIFYYRGYKDGKTLEKNRQSFGEYLEVVWSEDNPQVLDDDMDDHFNNWLSGLDTDDLIDYANEWSNQI